MVTDGWQVMNDKGQDDLKGLMSLNIIIALISCHYAREAIQ